MVKRSTLVGNIDEGGLKMPDTKSMFKALQIKWIQRYNNVSLAPWRHIILKTYISPYGGNMIFHCNVKFSQVNKWNYIPLFYREVLISYFDLVKPRDVKITSQCIYNNHCININGKPFFFTKGCIMLVWFYRVICIMRMVL